MTHATGTRLFWSVLAGLLVAGLVFAFWPRPIEVDVVVVKRGPLVMTVLEEGRTRIRDVFVVAAPVRGRAQRIDMEEGDTVIAGETVVAQIEPIDPDLLDARSEIEAQAAAAAAAAGLALAEAELAQARAELDFATAEVERMRELAARKTISTRAVEDAERLFFSSKAAVATGEAAVRMRQNQLRAAEARLLDPVETAAKAGVCDCVPIFAPVDGRVLRVIHESEGVVGPGEPLLEIGDPRDLEIVAEYLSAEAVRITPGQRVQIGGWGGDTILDGVVRLVEPFGFTKVSALGIEEQRVAVVIDVTSPPEAWQRLGHGFQVETRVILSELTDVAKVPLTALFRDGDTWSLFELVDGRARAAVVELGARTDYEAQILSGAEAGSVIVRYPDDRIEDGVRLRPRR